MASLTPPAMQLDLFGFDDAPPAVSDIPTRRILLGNQVICYALRRSKRRSIGFSIDRDGLRITAPRWVTLADIDQAIRSKQRWIIDKLRECQSATAQRQAQQITWRDGATLPYLGSPITLRLRRASRAMVTFDETSRELTLLLTGDATEAQLRSRTLKWLQQQAASVFAARMPVYAERLDVRYRTMKLSSATTRWGSCSMRGTICLNWRLIHLPETLIDYVVAHELSHLREMNHSERFWAAVESVYPDYRTARQALREQALNALPLI
ncbi:MAG: metal-dependent hydrolase [Burkholderiaceae bacterium]|nr:metal-dependent hydrolase [Burkholderiaceae bacterium]